MKSIFENNQNLYVIQALMKEYHTIFLVNSETLTLQLYYANSNSKLAGLAKENSSLVEVVKLYSQKYVAEKDKEKFLNEVNLENILKKIDEQGIFTLNYLRSDENQKETYQQAYFAKVSSDTYILAFRDIDKYIRLELESAAQEATIRQYEEDAATIELIHESFDAAAWSMDFDENYKIVKCNWSRTFRKMLGFVNQEDFPDVLESWSDLLYGEDKEKVLNAYWNAVNDKSGKSVFDLDFRLFTKNMELRWFHASGRISRRPDGSPKKFVGIFQDIQDEKESRRKFEEQFEIVNALSRDYANIFKVNLKERTGEIIKLDGYVTKGLSKDNPKIFPYDALVRQYVKDRVYKDDQENLLKLMDIDVVKQRLSENSEYISNYRVPINEEIHHYQFKYILIGDDIETSQVIAAFKNIDASIKAEEERKSLIRLSETDQMTGLLNHESGESKTTQQLQQKTGGIFFIMDIDGFKHFNDTYGHNAGDKVIKGIAKCIKCTFREDDITYRLGGDEFAVFAPTVCTEEIAGHIMARFIKNVENLTFSDFEKKVTVSIGVGIVPKEKSLNFVDLYKAVDSCLYVSKKEAGNIVTYIDF